MDQTWVNQRQNPVHWCGTALPCLGIRGRALGGYVAGGSTRAAFVSSVCCLTHVCMLQSHPSSGLVFSGSWRLGSPLLLPLDLPQGSSPLQRSLVPRGPLTPLGPYSKPSGRGQLGAGSEQRDFAGRQREPLLMGTDQVLHMHSHHTTQLQAL